MRIVLASKSPRRKELLGKIYPDFVVITKETDETLPFGTEAKKGVELLAVKKGEAVLDLTESDDLIISSDTLVELDGKKLGKPENEEDAVKMLLSLSGKVHNVHTGVAVHYKGRVFSSSDTACVKFLNFGEKEAWEYVRTGEPMDKAGAYAIQGIGKKFVEGFQGDFEAIVGLGTTLTKSLVEKAIKETKGDA